MEVASLMEGACSYYIGGQFNGGRMVMLQVTLMEGEWTLMVVMEVVMEVASKRGRMVMLQRSV